MADQERACLAIADISGYTSYLAGVELDHAQDILSDLTVTVVEALAPFQLLKLEGDAAFVYIPGDEFDGSLLQDTVEGTYLAFRRRLRDIKQASTCECNACIRIPDLDLKIVVHHGTFGRQRLMGLEELVGPDVILVHRLLKNDIKTATGFDAYAFYTQAIIDAAGIDADSPGLLPHEESTDVAGTVRGRVRDLGEVWARSLEGPRFQLPEDQIAFVWEQIVEGHGGLVFELLTSPTQRVAWNPGLDGITEDSPGGRRGERTVNHCMHGKDVYLEQYIDWRPPESFSSLATIPTPGGDAMKVYTVTMLIPQDDGATKLQMTFGTTADQSPDDNAGFFATIRGNLDHAIEPFRVVVAEETARRRRDAPSQAELPERKGRHLKEPVAG